MTHKKIMTDTGRARYRQLRDVTFHNILDFQHPDLVKTMLPADWRDISIEGTPVKTRLTIRIDKDVVTFFRKLGPGYQTTINRVLRAFMLAKLTDILGDVPGGVTLADTDEETEVALQLEVAMKDILEKARQIRMGL